MTKNRHAAFTLMELMVVILIIGLLAAAAIPIMQGRVDNAKWAEANAAAGMIRRAVKVCYAEDEVAVTGNLGNVSVYDVLSIEPSDLAGTYFVASDYNIDSINSEGIPTITVTGSQANAPTGSRTFYPNGDWTDTSSSSSSTTSTSTSTSTSSSSSSSSSSSGSGSSGGSGGGGRGGGTGGGRGSGRGP